MIYVIVIIVLIYKIKIMPVDPIEVPKTPTKGVMIEDPSEYNLLVRILVWMLRKLIY